MTSKQYLQKLTTALKEQNEFYNGLKEKQLSNIGLYQKSTEIQKPIIDTIQKTNDDLMKKIEDNKVNTVSSTSNPKDTCSSTIVNPNTISIIENITKQSVNESYSLVKTGKLITSPALNKEFDEWKFNSNAKSNIGKFVLMNRDGEECIWHYSKMNDGIRLTEGLNEILFNDASNMNIITNEDITDWKLLINSAGLSSVYHNSSLAKKLDNPKDISNNPKDISNKPTKEGSGLPITIPKDPEELKEELMKQLSAFRAGHSSTFNHSNAIMTELLKQKLMTSKEYRDILKCFFHV